MKNTKAIHKPSILKRLRHLAVIVRSARNNKTNWYLNSLGTTKQYLNSLGTGLFMMSLDKAQFAISDLHIKL